jgi:hypothetical protein
MSGEVWSLEVDFIGPIQTRVFKRHEGTRVSR